MNTEKEKTCDERIAGRLKSRLADYILPDYKHSPLIWKDYAKRIKAVSGDIRSMSIDDLAEACRTRLCESVLSIDKETVFNVCLSTGGPADGFRFYYNAHKELIRCEYYFQDWFDGAVRSIDLETADKLADLFCLVQE